MKPFVRLAFFLVVFTVPSLGTASETAITSLQAEAETLFAPGRDLADVKLAIDHMVDASVNEKAVLATIDRMAEQVKAMTEGGASGGEKVAALKRYLYEAGSWNDGQAFQYDLDDPLGEKSANRILQRFLTTRRGNCVTMPILFMVLGQRLGLKMTLAEAPLHAFVKYTDDEGNTWNLETTSGAGTTRDAWYRQKLPMTDKAVENGVYLRPLSRDESVALMAGFLVEHYLDAEEYENAVAVADVLLSHSPASAYLMAKKGTAYQRLLQREIIGKYKRMEEIPPNVRQRADHWYQENQAIFARLDALGWRIEDGQAQ